MATYTAVATPKTVEGSAWRSVTVLAANGSKAERAAAAAIAKDERAIVWLLRRRLAARLVEIDGTIHYIGRWPDPGENAA
jgi:hypothetical protein